MRVQRISAKLGNMRKPADFVVYPASKTESRGTVLIQSSHRIAEFDPATGKGVLSKHVGSGAYFLHLTKMMGASDIVVPTDVIAAAVAAIPKPGDEIGPGVYIGGAA